MSIFTVIIVIIVIERDVKVLRRYACEGVKVFKVFSIVSLVQSLM